MLGSPNWNESMQCCVLDFGCQAQCIMRGYQIETHQIHDVVTRNFVASRVALNSKLLFHEMLHSHYRLLGQISLQIGAPPVSKILPDTKNKLIFKMRL